MITGLQQLMPWEDLRRFGISLASYKRRHYLLRRIKYRTKVGNGYLMLNGETNEKPSD